MRRSKTCDLNADLSRNGPAIPVSRGKGSCRGRPAPCPAARAGQASGSRRSTVGFALGAWRATSPGVGRRVSTRHSLPSRLSTSSQRKSSQQYSTAQRGRVEQVPSDLANGRRAMAMGRRKTERDKETNTTSLNLFGPLSLVPPGRRRHTMV